MRHQQAIDVTHVGSQCELSLKIPGESGNQSVHKSNLIIYVLTSLADCLSSENIRQECQTALCRF